MPRLPKGKMKGKQRGSAVSVSGYTVKSGPRKGTKVKGYKRGMPGGKLG